MGIPFKWALAFALTAVGVWLLAQLTAVIFMLLGGLLLAATLYPGVRALERIRLPRIAAIMILLAALLVLVTATVLWILPPFFEQAIQAFNSLPGLYEVATERLSRLREIYPILPRARDIIAWIAGRALAWLQQGFRVTWQVSVTLALVFTAVVLGVFVLLDGKNVLKQFTDRMPASQAHLTLTIARAIRDQVGSYILGLIILATCVGTLVTLALWLVGMPFPLVLGVMAGLMDLVPYIGPFISGAIAVAVGIGVDPGKALWTLIAFVVIQQIEAQLLSPFILGRTTQVSPIWVIVALFVGGTLFGLAGMFFAVPIAIVIKVLVEILFPVRR
jgi:predicted PurR-regulated permease PerM